MVLGQQSRSLLLQVKARVHQLVEAEAEAEAEVEAEDQGGAAGLVAEVEGVVAGRMALRWSRLRNRQI